MSQELILTLYTLHQLSEHDVVQRLWACLDVPLVQPIRYDSVERARKPFAPNLHGDAVSLYGREGILFVRGNKDGFLAFFSRERNGLSLWRFYLNASAVKGNKCKLWLQWIFDLCETFPVLYGMGCSTVEYDAKHLVLEYFPDGGRARKTYGVAIREFFQYLPGIYWMNIFGKELKQAFKTRMQMLEHLSKVKYLAQDQVLIQIGDSVFTENMDERLRIEKEMADLLGAEYFFDRFRMNELEFKKVPQLAAVIGEY
jgi:hypothetical protein